MKVCQSSFREIEVQNAADKRHFRRVVTRQRASPNAIKTESKCADRRPDRFELDLGQNTGRVNVRAYLE